MAHGVKEGEIAYNVGNGVPWHGIGFAAEGRMTVHEAYEHAGLDWRVHSTPLSVPITDPVSLQPTYKEIGTHVANVRSDTGQVLGIVGHKYQPIQNYEQRDFIEALTGEGAQVVDVAGALFDGRQVFWTLKLPVDLVIGGEDRIEQYLLTVNGHDGCMPYRMFHTPVRAVCANTVNAALRGRKGESGLYLRHTVNVRDHVAEAQRALGLAAQYYRDIGDKFEDLMSAKVSETTVRGYFEAVVPDNPNAKNTTRTENVRRQLMVNYQGAPGSAQSRGRAWGAYNAVTYYTSHQQSKIEDDVAEVAEKKRQSRFSSLLLGTSNNLQQRAFDSALDLVGAA